MAEAPYNRLHEKGFISIGCQPCTRPVLPGQHEREGRWWWEEATHKECGLHAGNLIGKSANLPPESKKARLSSPTAGFLLSGTSVNRQPHFLETFLNPRTAPLVGHPPT